MPEEPSLAPEEISRYMRHILLPEIGGMGQQRLKAARVLVIGAGGLGSPVLQYLAAAGVGTIGIIDDDIVSLSNLQRQVIHSTDRIGQAKTTSAATSISAINPLVKVVAHQVRLTGQNADALLEGYDLLVDGSDNIATRYLSAEIAEAHRILLVTGAVGRFDGSVTVLAPFENGPDGKPLPRYVDLFPEVPPEGMLPVCAETGILGALTGVIGTLMAMEVIKLVTRTGEPLFGRLLLYDGLAARFEAIKYRRRSD